MRRRRICGASERGENGKGYLDNMKVKEVHCEKRSVYDLLRRIGHVQLP